jgi:hypothetical protein
MCGDPIGPRDRHFVKAGFSCIDQYEIAVIASASPRATPPITFTPVVRSEEARPARRQPARCTVASVLLVRSKVGVVQHGYVEQHPARTLFKLGDHSASHPLPSALLPICARFAERLTSLLK